MRWYTFSSQCTSKASCVRVPDSKEKKIKQKKLTNFFNFIWKTIRDLLHQKKRKSASIDQSSIVRSFRVGGVLNFYGTNTLFANILWTSEKYETKFCEQLPYKIVHCEQCNEQINENEEDEVKKKNNVENENENENTEYIVKQNEERKIVSVNFNLLYYTYTCSIRSHAMSILS